MYSDWLRDFAKINHTREGVMCHRFEKDSFPTQLSIMVQEYESQNGGTKPPFGRIGIINNLIEIRHKEIVDIISKYMLALAYDEDNYGKFDLSTDERKYMEKTNIELDDQLTEELKILNDELKFLVQYKKDLEYRERRKNKCQQD